MNLPFLWWIVRSTRNRARRQFRQLRSPRYLIATLFGLLYLVLMFWGWLADDGLHTELSGRHLVAARYIGPLLIAAVAAWWWLWGGYRRAILFTPAETHLLLPAPIERRALIRFKIMQAQVPILFSAAIFGLFTRGSPLPWPLRVLALWLMFATMHLHQIAASVVHAAAEEHGGSGLRRNRVAVAVFGLAFVVLSTALARTLLALRGATSLQHGTDIIVSVLSGTGPRLVLAPFRLLVAPVVATGVGEWALAGAGVALLCAAHYLWLQRTDAAFEETAASEGARRAELLAAARSGRGGVMLAAARRNRRIAAPWLPLPPTGRAAYAIFWKNVLMVQRLLRPRTVLTILVVVGTVILINVVIEDGPGDVVRGLSIMLFSLAGVMTVVGALIFRNDVRTDLAYLDTIRTYPLRGRAIVSAGVAATTLCVTALQLALLLPALALAVSAGMVRAGPALATAAAALLALPVLNALAVLIQNALTLLFPAWSRIGNSGPGGMETMGQNMLTMIATLVLLALAAVPPAIAAVVIGAPLSLQFGPFGVLPAASAALAVTAVEIVVATRWLGRLFESTELTGAGVGAGA